VERTGPKRKRRGAQAQRRGERWHDGPPFTTALGITTPMGHVIYPQPTSPSDVDLSWMIGRTITSVGFHEPIYWSFQFGEEAHISVECPWRILKRGRTVRSSEDHKQQYGLPAPIDAAAEATKLLSAVKVTTAQLRIGTSDILVEFSEHLRLEIIPISSGYEGWQMTDPFRTEYFAQGGGQICVWRGDA